MKREVFVLERELCRVLDTVYVKHPVQVIEFMLENSREKAMGFAMP